MTTGDWIIDIVLVLVVLRQIKEEKMGRSMVLIPSAIVVYVCFTYLGGFPATGHNIGLLIGCLLVGTALGVVGGFITHVRGEAGQAYIRAGWAAATLWVASMGARLSFIIWITHSGKDSFARFCERHHITGEHAVSDALVVLALSEVVFRIGILLVRGLRAKRDSSMLSSPPASVTRAVA